MKKLLLVAGFALALFAPAQALAANTWDVNASAYANDTNCTTAVRQCHTIGAAVSAAVAGDTVTVAAGTYSEVVTLSKTLTLRGAQAGIDARTRSGSESVIGSPDGRTELTISANDVVVDGFTIQGNTNVISSAQAFTSRRERSGRTSSTTSSRTTSWVSSWRTRPRVTRR